MVWRQAPMRRHLGNKSGFFRRGTVMRQGLLKAQNAKIRLFHTAPCIGQILLLFTQPRDCNALCFISDRFREARGLCLFTRNAYIRCNPSQTKRQIMRKILISTAVLCGLSTAALAETHVFNLYIAGLKAGSITTTTKWNGNSYTTNGKVRPSGLIAKIAKVSYDGSVSGAASGVALRPKSYSGHAVTKSRESRVKMAFSGAGVPKVLSYTPERAARPTDVNPATQKGAIDLLSAAFSVFRDAPAGELCSKNYKMFDGRRATRLKVGKAAVSGNTATCNGSYQRVAGFSESALKKGSTFPFTLFYQKQDDGSFRLKSVNTKTTVGSAKLVRQ